MSDRVEKTAFDLTAPENERTDALAQLQRQHFPTSEGALLPRDEVKEIISFIDTQYEETELRKALTNRVIVPFPSKHNPRKPGMSSLYLDDIQVQSQGDYYNKKGVLSNDTLRAIAHQTPLLNGIIFTRIRQGQRFARIAEQDTALPGFEIRHLDRKHKLTDSEQENFNLLNRFFMNCGFEFNARKRKVLRRDSFSTFFGKVVRDSLTMDSAAIETEWKRDMSTIDGFYAVDGATIRLCNEEGYRGNDEIFAVQVADGLVRTAYTFNDLIYEPRNPQTDVDAAGYGLSEVELLVKVVTGYLNAMTINSKGFDSNSIPRGILHLSGNYDQKDIDAFKRYWKTMMQGVQNSWAMPVMISKDQESKAAFEEIANPFNEMLFSKWITLLSSIACSIFGMSPLEINCDSFSGGNTSTLSGSDTEEKLALSKDSGLRPLLGYFENLFTDYLIQNFSTDYCFRWTGLDAIETAQKWESDKLVLTVNELRAERGYEAHLDETLGNAPLNPSLIGVYMQSIAPEEPAQQQNKSKDKPKLALAKSLDLPVIDLSDSWWGP